MINEKIKDEEINYCDSLYIFHDDLIYFISACPVPSTPDVMYGKDCPLTEDLDFECIDGVISKSYPNLQEAWDRCAIVSGCEFVMRYYDGKYYLRRLSDPNYTAKAGGVWGYFFKMCSNYMWLLPKQEYTLNYALNLL